MTYMWNLKKQYKRTYLQNKNRLIDRKRTYSYQKGSNEGTNWEYGIRRHKPPHGK